MTDQLPPRILQIVGLAIVLASGVFWAITGRQSVEFLSAGMTLITLGSFWNAQQRSTPPAGHDYEPPPPPKPTHTSNGDPNSGQDSGGN